MSFYYCEYLPDMSMLTIKKSEVYVEERRNFPSGVLCGKYHAFIKADTMIIAFNEFERLLRQNRIEI